jgi:hypothetical protein
MKPVSIARLANEIIDITRQFLQVIPEALQIIWGH